jgi:hypothetical protein
MMQRLLRAAAVAMFSVALLAVLGGGSCKFCSGSNCNHDDDDDDDDDNLTFVPPEPPSPPTSRSPRGSVGRGAPVLHLSTDPAFVEPVVDLGAYELEVFELAGSDDLESHPAAELRAIQGVNLFSSWRLPKYDGAAFQAFTARLIEANPALLQPVEGAGHLVPAGSWSTDSLVVVTWVQQTADRSHGWILDEARRDGRAEVRFLFDPFGNLLSIGNTTVVPPGVPRPELANVAR